jgi:hypothetical protein
MIARGEACLHVAPATPWRQEDAAMTWYEDSSWPVRDDLAQAHARAWERIAAPGVWLTGAERVAIAAEARHARAGCRLCRARKEALSPLAVEGAHDAAVDLAPAMLEAIHRIVTDPGRLTRSWQQGVLAAGLAETAYVELLSVVAQLTAVDTFAAGLGLPLRSLPEPLPGAPSRRRPAGAKPGLAWVATLAPEDAEGEDRTLYPATGSPANIRRAMSLVPEAVRGFFDLVKVQYLPPAAMLDFGHEHRAITHAQIELLAGRVSAINQCVY